MRLQVLGHGRNPFIERAGDVALRRHAKLGRQRPGQPLDLTGRQRQPMVGLRAVQLTDVSTTYKRFISCLGGILRGRSHAPAVHEVGRIAEIARTTLQEVGIQREHHVGLVEVVDRIHRLAESHLRPRHAVSRWIGS